MEQSIRVGVSAVIVRDGAMLFVEFHDEESGKHYNLPGGGVHVGEALHDAVKREVLEETCMTVDVGRLLLVWEYVPSHYAQKYGPQHKVALVFQCEPHADSEARLPEIPDSDQTGVQWVRMEDVPSIPLLPSIGEQLLVVLQSEHDNIAFVDSI